MSSEEARDGVLPAGESERMRARAATTSVGADGELGGDMGGTEAKDWWGEGGTRDR